MFEDKMEKGLFTFYWQENQQQKQESKRSQAHSQLREITSNQKKHKGIEEKKKRFKHHKTERQQPQRSNKHQQSDYLHSDKETKNMFIPHHITISPSIDPINIEKGKVKSIKQKHSKDITNTRTIQSDRQKYQKVRNSLQGLFFSQKSNECHKKTLQIDESLILNKSSYLNTLRPMKKRKATENYRNQQNEGLNMKLPTIKAPQDPTLNCKPPLFGKYSHKKLKHIKQNFFIQKIFSDKVYQENSSIINIGICSNDESKMRWKKRKQEFLSLINKHISKQGLASH